jgi:pyridoxal phosphate enzyme (YggS family)
MSARRDEIAANLTAVEARILRAVQSAERARSEVTLIAVTKTYPVSDVEILKELGIENFAENRDEEGDEKSGLVDGVWHFQGQIQSKKLSSISRWANYIHSIDNSAHLEKLERALATQGSEKKIGIFLQLSLDGAPGRGGVREDELEPLASSVLATPHLSLMGLMCVPPVESQPDIAFSEVARIHQKFLSTFSHATGLSIGMSGDFESAIAHGATHIRVGSSILGPRTYPQ